MLSLILALLLGGPPGPDGLPTVPGVANPEVTQATISRTICVSGWTKIERAKLGSKADTLKKKLMLEAGIPWSQSRLFELDHAWSIEDGGSPTDPNNLWLEPYTGPLNAHQKDRVETLVKRMVCAGKMPLSQAGPAVLRWTDTYRKFVGPLP